MNPLSVKGVKYGREQFMSVCMKYVVSALKKNFKKHIGKKILVYLNVQKLL